MKNFPDFVWNHPAWRPVLHRVFSYDAPFYDLCKYEEMESGSGLRIWNEIQSKFAHEIIMAKRRLELSKTMCDYLTPRTRMPEIPPLPEIPDLFIGE